jgi:hypothetical protein
MDQIDESLIQRPEPVVPVIGQEQDDDGDTEDDEDAEAA